MTPLDYHDTQSWEEVPEMSLVLPWPNWVNDAPVYRGHITEKDIDTRYLQQLPQSKVTELAEEGSFMLQ